MGSDRMADIGAAPGAGAGAAGWVQAVVTAYGTPIVAAPAPDVEWAMYAEPGTEWPAPARGDHQKHSLWVCDDAQRWMRH